jgi:hypothetical protein
MLKRFFKDESGVALGLAVIMIVLIGVMGAGLLVFVRNDLEAVVEVNQGQRATDVADAGLHAARQQIMGDKVPGHYDVDDGTGCDSSKETPALSGEDWSPGAGGQTRTFAGGQFTVTIQWLNPEPPLGTPDSCIAPEAGPLPGGTDYFKTISTGRYGNATRRVEAIYQTYNLNVPRAYYSPGPITISGTACIDRVSVFSLSNITFNGSGGCSSGGHMQGGDLAYGDWKNNFNATARNGSMCTLPDGTETMCAGVGTPGTISSSPRLGTRDYDSTTTPKFVKTPSTDPQGSGEITFPFDLASQPDANRLCDEAKAQGNYEEYTTTGNKNLDSWPADSSYTTVVCKVFKNTNSSNKLIWTVGGNENLTGDYEGCKGPIREGTLVIRGGNFSTKSNTALFRGVVVVRGAEGSETTDLGSSTDTGNTCLDGFVNATSEIKIAGTVRPSTSLEANDRPGFYGVRTWSWRELYE